MVAMIMGLVVRRRLVNKMKQVSRSHSRNGDTLTSSSGFLFRNMKIEYRYDRYLMPVASGDSQFVSTDTFLATILLFVDASSNHGPAFAPMTRFALDAMESSLTTLH